MKFQCWHIPVFKTGCQSTLDIIPIVRIDVVSCDISTAYLTVTLVVKVQKSVFISCLDQCIHVSKTKRTAASLLRRDRLAAMTKLESATGSPKAIPSVRQIADECCCSKEDKNSDWLML